MVDQPAIQIRRARPGDIGDIVMFLNRVRKDGPRVDQAEVMQSFADKGFMVARADGHLVGVVAWHVENLVACVEELFISPAGLRDTLGPQVVAALEDAARQLMAEAVLIFITPQTPKASIDMVARTGYKLTDPATLSRAWREAAMNLIQPNMKVLFKQLRESRVTRPI